MSADLVIVFVLSWADSSLSCASLIVANWTCGSSSLGQIGSILLAVNGARPTIWCQNYCSLDRQAGRNRHPQVPWQFAPFIALCTARSLHKRTLIAATSLKNASICLSFAVSCSGCGGPASRSAAEYSLEGVSLLCKRCDSCQMVGSHQHTLKSTDAQPDCRGTSMRDILWMNPANRSWRFTAPQPWTYIWWGLALHGCAFWSIQCAQW